MKAYGGVEVQLPNSCHWQ